MNFLKGDAIETDRPIAVSLAQGVSKSKGNRDPIKDRDADQREAEGDRRRQEALDFEIAQAAKLFDRLDSDLLDNLANNVIGI